MPDDKKHYLEDRTMHPAPVKGTPMSAEAKQRAAIAGQVNELKQRATVMNLSVAQLIQLQDGGQVSNPLVVPAEFRAYLTQQAEAQRATMQNVQRQQPQAPQVNLPPDHPLYQQALAAAQQQAQQAQQAQQIQPPPQVAPHMSEQIAPAAPPLHDQATAMQMAQFGPPPSDADLASLDALMGASQSEAMMMGEEYEAAQRYVQQTASPPQQEPEVPKTFDVEHMPPGAVPPKRERQSAVSQLKNPVWRDVDSLILWESFCSCIMEADAHMLHDPLQRKALIKRLAKFQAAIEEQKGALALLYLKEIEKRARHRAMLTRRLTTLGVHPIRLTNMAQDYQMLLGPINKVISAAALSHAELEEKVAAPKEQPTIAVQPEAVEAIPVNDKASADGEPPAKEG